MRLFVLTCVCTAIFINATKSDAGASSTPFSGTVSSIPGTIAAANFAPLAIQIQNYVIAGGHLECLPEEAPVTENTQSHVRLRKAA